MRRIQAQISAGPSQRFARFTLLAGKLLIAFLTVALWPPVAAAQYCDWNCSDYSGSGNDNFTPYDPYANYSVPTSGSTPSPPPPDLPFTPEFNPTLPASFSPGTTPSDQEMSTVRGTLAFNDSVATRPLSTSASEQNATDPVRDGELIAQVTDVSLPGSIPFEFRRTYRSRTRHLGVLGYGWDHSYNKRIIAADDCGDVDLMTGDSGRVRFSVGKVTPDSVTYSAPSGVPLFLRKTGTSADTTAWDLYDGSALRYHFNQYGLLSNIYDKQGHTLSVVWEVTDRTLRYKDQNGNDQVTVYPVLLGSDLMWRVQYIKDTTGRHIYFNYLHGYGNDPGWFLQCLSISPDCSQPLVSYEYSPVDPLTPPDDPDYGNLVKVVRPDGTGFAYSYYDTCTRANGLTCTSSGYLADDDADAYCANACGTTADCHSASLCGRASPDCKAYLSGIKQTGGNPEEACTDSLLSFEQCMQQYVNHSVPNHNNPLCEYTRDTGSSCAQACMSDVMAHGQWSCGIIEPRFA